MCHLPTSLPLSKKKGEEGKARQGKARQGKARQERLTSTAVFSFTIMGVFAFHILRKVQIFFPFYFFGKNKQTINYALGTIMLLCSLLTRSAVKAILRPQSVL